MSNDCLLLRKEVRSLGNRLAKAPNNNALRLTYCNCKREYNKLKNKLKKDFFHSLIKQINEINPKNTKEFWGSINNYKKKNNNCEPAISAKEWEIHYKNLLASSNNDKTDTNQNIENKNHNFSNTSLNVPITCKEIKDCIKKLKKGKSGGPDLIINEFLKIIIKDLVMLSFVLLLTILSALVNALDNGLALTPTMGWRNWERFRCEVDCEHTQMTVLVKNYLWIWPMLL
ncbi:unnamed protein product [Mytilus edulis]|uniref:Uncharacterized protein n=1 Tax=Mytilus edulis TaxID=6550 RepID=A0A8S3UBY4_MYTED|nr:unnamed protein product [Mytilus edulis]